MSIVFLILLVESSDIFICLLMSCRELNICCHIDCKIRQLQSGRLLQESSLLAFEIYIWSDLAANVDLQIFISLLSVFWANENYFCCWQHVFHHDSTSSMRIYQFYQRNMNKWIKYDQFDWFWAICRVILDNYDSFSFHSVLYDHFRLITVRL